MEGSILSRPHVWEDGDKLYLTTPLTLATPTEQQVEEYAFASAVKSKAPNDNIGWLQGRYVEAGRPNLNNAMWLSNELAMKSLTPMLMPITVMHDPRASVGVIADCKLIREGESAARIDNILAVWKHRYPEVWEEAVHNMERGQMMQSMECYTPWYTCSECAQQYIKLPQGAERASWCDHLRSNSGRRILGDVCFTGTGLIFGSQGGRGAYTEAYLDHFHSEVAEFHQRVHTDSAYRPTQGSQNDMGMVQIEQSELDTLRRERNDARTQVDELSADKRDLTTKVEKAEADLTAVQGEKATLEGQVKTLEDEKASAGRKDNRLKALGDGFLAKLGEFTKERLHEQAAKASDEEWESALKEREELAGVKRDHKAEAASENGGEGGTKAAENGGGTEPAPGPSFKDEEVASFMQRGVANPVTTSGGRTSAGTGDGAVRSLARAFAKPAASSNGNGDK